MKKLNSHQFWGITIAMFLVISIIIFVIVSIWASFLVSTIIGVSIFTALSLYLVFKSVVSVPERYNYVVTLFGAYYKTLKPGLNLVYPWFNVFSLASSYCVSEHSIGIFKDANGDFSEMVEFKESAAWIMLSARLKVVDTEKAFSAVEDVYREIRDIGKKYFRDYAEDKDILDFHDKDSDIDVDALFGEDSDIVKHIEEEWGVEIIDVRLEDVILSDADRKVREEVYAERNKLEVIDLQNKQTVAKAKAKAKEIRLIAAAEKSSKRLEGEGFKEALDKLIETNLDPSQASQFLQAIKKWEAVPQVSTAFFSDNEGGDSNMSKQAMAEIIAVSNEINKK